MCVRNVIELQLVQGGVAQDRSAGIVGGIHHRQILGLGAVKLRGIDFKERLAAMNQFTGGINIKFLDPALEFRRHIHLCRFVIINGANRANRPSQGSAGDWGRLQIHQLNGRRVDRNDGAAGGRGRIGIDRYHVHAHAILARLGVGFARHHRGFVIKDFAGAGGGLRGGRFVNRL